MKKKYSNRFLGFLLLFFIIWITYILYSYFFKISYVNFEINSNTNSYSWTLYNVKYKKDFFCKQEKCIIENLPPFKYKLTIKKDNYNTFFKQVDLSKNNKIDVVLEKDIFLEPLEKKEFDKKDFIRKLKAKKQNFIEYKNQKLKYNNVVNNDNYIYFKSWDFLILQNVKNNTYIKKEFIPSINYIKQNWNDLFIINTNIGSFYLNKKTKNLDYFSMFDDYVKKWDYYIWVIKEDDFVRKNNFWFTNNKLNLVVLYNIKNKKVRIIDSFWSKITKIYLENNKVFIELWSDKKYELKNI